MFARKKGPAPNSFHPSVSVIIPARNEAEGISACLESVLNQNYPEELVEIVLVNDHSTDQTGKIAREIAHSNPNLKVLDLETGNINSYKKAAISAGIETAKGEIIIQTDADCVVEPGWIAAMVAHFREETALVSGPVCLDYRKRWIEIFQALESMGLVTIGAGSLLAGRPNMCNGANLAYRKTVFEEVGGFRGVDNIASGDDELLLQKIHRLKKYRLDFAKDRAAIVRTRALPDWQSLKAQRLRWVSKARYYPNKWVNLTQALSYLALLGIPVLTGMAIWDERLWWLVLTFFILKLLADAYILSRAAKFFHKLPLLNYLLPMQPIYILYVLWIGIAGNFVSTYTWKDRKVK